MKLHEAILKSREQGTRFITRKGKCCFLYDSCDYTLEEILADDWEVEPAPKPKMKLYYNNYTGDIRLLTSDERVFDKNARSENWTEVDLKELIE